MKFFQKLVTMAIFSEASLPDWMKAEAARKPVVTKPAIRSPRWYHFRIQWRLVNCQKN